MSDIRTAEFEVRVARAGRPRKPEEEKGTQPITIKFTQKQYDTICAEARERELTLSEYIRERIFVGQKYTGPSPGPYYAG